jgi:uncharacterized membrane protein YkoI
MKNVPHIITRSAFGILVLTIGMLASQTSFASDAAEQAALLQALPKSKLTLSDGLKQATKGAEMPISAKFELDDDKHLSLSIYTAEKGLAVDSEHNVLKELSGSPEKAPWKAEVEVFKDIPHVARASGQLALAAISKHSLLDVVAQAQKEHSGMVLSISPAVQERLPVFVVLVADKGKVTEYVYDAMTGKPVAPKK